MGKANEIVQETLLLPIDEREAYLAQSCGEDETLRQEVEQLFLNQVAAQTSVTLDFKSGDDLGQYRILELIGEGGMGSVYLAEQRAPIVRKVALKVVKLGMDTKDVLARFDAERQALAMMSHPNVAAVLDAGSTASGRPFFAMEYVQGIPITQYCDKNKLTVRDRAKLLKQACEGVQHAHQKGIIHRDLKPSNILVTESGGEPLVKIIDFGIAKSTQQRLTSHTLHTQLGVFLGTPDYTSPEQADRDALDVDSRSDVYSLGVVLYQLIVGRRPFARASFASMDITEIKRVIREVEPATPARRFKSLREAQEELASRRATSLPALSRSLNGDLSWVVLRAMEKDRASRYPSASALAADLARYLAGEPVEARAQTRAYRMRKFVSRHKLSVVVGAGVAMAVVAVAVSSTYLYLEAERQARIASDVIQFQSKQLSRIEPHKMGQDLRSALIQEIEENLESQGASSEEAEQALEQIETGLAGVNFTNLGLMALRENVFDPAIGQIKSEHQSDPLLYAELLHSLAGTMADLGLTEHALEPQRLALEARQSHLGPAHQDSLASLNNLVELNLDMGNLELAEPLATRAVDLAGPPETPHALAALNNLVMLYGRSRQFEEAEPYARNLVAAVSTVLGDNHPDAPDYFNSLGSVLFALGKREEAIEAFERGVSLANQVLGAEHPDAIIMGINYAVVQAVVGETDGFERLQRILVTSRSALGDSHPHTRIAMRYLGVAYTRKGDFNRAEQLARESLEVSRRVSGPSHIETLESTQTYSDILKELGRGEDALGIIRSALSASNDAHGEMSATSIRLLSARARVLSSLNQREKAERDFRRVLHLSQESFGESSIQTANAQKALDDFLEESQ